VQCVWRKHHDLANHGLTGVWSVGLRGCCLSANSLDPEAGQLKQFLDFLIAQLKLRQNFELVQSYMHLFLKVHGDVIATSPALIDSLQEAVASQELSWVHIEGLFQHSLCVLGFLRGGGM